MGTMKLKDLKIKFLTSFDYLDLEEEHAEDILDLFIEFCDEQNDLNDNQILGQSTII